MSCLMKYSSTSPSARPGRKKAFGAKRAAFETGQPHADHRRLDNCADIETILLGDAGMGDAISAIEGAFQLRVSLVNGERVAAGCHEFHDLAEAFARESLIRGSAHHLAVELVRIEGAGTGGPE